MSADPGFVHLHVHSSYSLLEGALTIARLAELANKDRQPALALTDTDNMFGALEFSEKIASAGIQPIIGCALGIDFADHDNRGGAVGESWPRIVLLAARENGYRSLLRLCSRAYLETAPTDRPHIKLPWLAEEASGLIALSGGPNGPLDVAIGGGQSALALARCEALQGLLGDRLYIELQRHGMAAERLAEPALIELAYARGIPLVAEQALQSFAACLRKRPLSGGDRGIERPARPAAEHEQALGLLGQPGELDMRPFGLFGIEVSARR